MERRGARAEIRPRSRESLGRPAKVGGMRSRPVVSNRGTRTLGSAGSRSYRDDALRTHLIPDCARAATRTHAAEELFVAGFIFDADARGTKLACPVRFDVLRRVSPTFNQTRQEQEEEKEDDEEDDEEDEGEARAEEEEEEEIKKRIGRVGGCGGRGIGGRALNFASLHAAR